MFYCSVYVFIYKENEMNDYFKGILMGIIITLLLISMMGFGSGALGTKFNPMYVKIVG